MSYLKSKLLVVALMLTLAFGVLLSERAATTSSIQSHLDFFHIF